MLFSVSTLSCPIELKWDFSALLMSPVSTNIPEWFSGWKERNSYFKWSNLMINVLTPRIKWKFLEFYQGTQLCDSPSQVFCLYTYEFCLSVWKIVRSSVILLLPLFASQFCFSKESSSLFHNSDNFSPASTYQLICSLHQWPYFSTLHIISPPRIKWMNNIKSTLYQATPYPPLYWRR
jgi:hypothetical protein